MNNLFTSLSTVLYVSLFVAISCGVEEEYENKPKDNSDLLTEVNWRTTKIEMEISYEGSTNIITRELTECRKDDITKFTSDGKFLTSIGTSVCGGDDMNVSGVWERKRNKKTIAILVNGHTSEMEIVSLDRNTLKTKTKMSFDANGDGINDFEGSIIYTSTAL